MDDGDVLLNEILNARENDVSERIESARTSATAPTVAIDEDGKAGRSDKENHVQWALGGNGRFSPVGSTVAVLPSGVYEPFATPGMWGLEQLKITSDGIYTLPDMATELVMDEVQRFWSSEEKYKKHNLLYKRGLILWGPPGGGKTVTVKLLMSELVKRGGIVVIASQINLTVMCLKAIRRIEPKRSLIVVFEDIDELIDFSGEAGILSMLDGEHNIDNVLNLATTNYPDKLGARIINRPSRFDRRVFVGMPSEIAREAYLRKATNDGLENDKLAQWVGDTKNMSIAHLRELVAAVYCLDQPYEDVVTRLQKMAKPPKSVDGFKTKSMGFDSHESGD